jgi:SAM-dependent methyltransferase
MNWRDYWNQDTPIYASERHKLLHYGRIANDIVALIPSAEAVVLDHGCGEALAAERVARRCQKLYLLDAAPLVRERLKERFGGNAKIEVLRPEDLGQIPDGSLDLIVANSLVQYLALGELRDLLAVWREKLKPKGRLVLADVLPHEVSPLTDAKALLSFGFAGGFLTRAVLGLARTALSDYRKLRNELGLSRYGEVEMIELLRDHGFRAERRPQNLGHNQARMTFVATPSGD